MIGNMENLKIISVIHKMSKNSGSAASRKTSAFSIRTQGAMQYLFEDKSITVSAGEMIFLPRGSRYEYRKVSEEDTFGTLINIEADFEDNAPFVCSVEEFYDAEYIMLHLADLWKLGGASGKYKCYSLVYALISYISNLDNLEYEYKKKFDLIDTAVEYLQKHLFDPDLKINSLHTLSSVSDTYFRKIFKARFGTSPKNYVTEKRVSYAKSIIDSGEVTTVKDLAETVGYRDPLYFGKVFKKHYGKSPVNSF